MGKHGTGLVGAVCLVVSVSPPFGARVFGLRESVEPIGERSPPGSVAPRIISNSFLI